MVLLRSDGSFPLRGTGALALYGSGARRTLKGGTGSGDVNSRHVVTIEEGLEKAGFTLTTKAWLDAYEVLHERTRADFIADIKAGKDKAIGYLVGQVMKRSKGQANPSLAQKLIRERL